MHFEEESMTPSPSGGRLAFHLMGKKDRLLLHVVKNPSSSHVFGGKKAEILPHVGKDLWGGIARPMHLEMEDKV